MITVTYTSIDRCRKRRTFKTLKGATKFAHHWVGADAECGTGYAVSSDGVGKITVSGCSLYDIFPNQRPGGPFDYVPGQAADRN